MTILFQAKFLILAAWLTVANISVANAEKTIDLEILKEACATIGLKSGSNNFNNCVNKLSERDDLILKKIDNNTLSEEDILEIKKFEARVQGKFLLENEYEKLDEQAIKDFENRVSSRENINDKSMLDEILSIGLIVGGAYLLGTALTPVPPPPAATTNIFTTIIQETPKQGVIGY